MFQQMLKIFRGFCVFVGLTLLIAGAVHAFLVFYPGSLSVDSRAQLAQARLGQYNDGHPPIMAALWRQFLIVFDGPQPMLLFHLALFWSGLALIWNKLRHEFSGAAIFVALIGFFPTVIGSIGVIWKDIGLGSALLLIIALIVNPPRNRPVRYVLLGLLFFYATAVRHNAIAATLPLIFGLIDRYITVNSTLSGRRRLVIVTATGLLAGLALMVSIKSFKSIVLDAKEQHVEQQLYFHDLSFIGTKTGNEFIPATFRTKGYSLDAIQKALSNVRCSDPLIYYYESPFKIIDDEVAIHQLRNIWLRTIAKHPIYYLQLRSTMFASLNCIGFSECRAYHFSLPEEFGGGFKFMSKYRQNLASKLGQLSAETPLFTGWLWALLALVGLAVATFFKSTNQTMMISIFCSALFYNLGYFVAGVCCDFRYLWPTPIVVLIGWILLVREWRLYQRVRDASPFATHQI